MVDKTDIEALKVSILQARGRFEREQDTTMALVYNLLKCYHSARDTATKAEVAMTIVLDQPILDTVFDLASWKTAEVVIERAMSDE